MKKYMAYLVVVVFLESLPAYIYILAYGVLLPGFSPNYNSKNTQQGLNLAHKIQEQEEYEKED